MEELGKSKNVQSSPAAWPVDLKIGKNICIPVTGYKKVRMGIRCLLELTLDHFPKLSTSIAVQFPASSDFSETGTSM